MSDHEIEVVNRCGFCGEIFQIDKSDPHWSTGRGPLCPNRPPVPPGAVPDELTTADLTPTEHDHVINDFARCRIHNTIRAYKEEPCWRCWHDRRHEISPWYTPDLPLGDEQ